MLDPLTALAFSMFSGKGVYALVLGSGISRAAEIPTGWDITIDLIKKVAAACGEECGVNPEVWYEAKFGVAPDYADLLALVAKTPAERTNALASYFEAKTDEEKERGAKTPTAAHRAIARLVAKGYVRVILTTNFDRLLEQALAAEGVTATIISTDDMVRGALPIVHAACTVIKIHGDYRDTRFRNTKEELASYSPEMNVMLDRVIDEFGTIVVGWSAAWDVALRAVFTRASNRRFSMTWAAKGPLTSEGAELIAFRGGTVQDIESADQFFTSLLEKIESLEQYNSPHPMSVELAVATAKRLMTEARHRIQLHDLFVGETERTLDGLQASPLFMREAIANATEYLEAVEAGEAGVKMMLAMVATLAFFAQEDHGNILGTVIVRLLALTKVRRQRTDLNRLKQYPACLVFYVAGIAACVANRYATLVPLFRETEVSEEGQSDKRSVPVVLYIRNSLSDDLLNQASGVKNRVASSEQVALATREVLRPFVPDDEQFAEALDRFEYLLAIRYLEERLARDSGDHVWAPVGRFMYRHRNYGRHISAVLEEQGKDKGPASAFITSGLFSNAEDFAALSGRLMTEVVSKIFIF